MTKVIVLIRMYICNDKEEKAKEYTSQLQIVTR